MPALQHPSDAEILIDIGPVDAHWHDFEIGSLLSRGHDQLGIPIDWRSNLASVDKRDDKFVGSEFH
jgi:hypothetical protein